jgi:hypothetical protein
MADFAINAYLDPHRFEVAMDDIMDAVKKGADNGAQGAAEYVRDEMRVLLASSPHPVSEPSYTAPFKGPPGMLTTGSVSGGQIPGHLRDSVSVPPRVIRGTAKVQASAVYARIQEFGGFTGTHHSTYIPPRPYFRPTVMSLSTWGEVEHIFYDEWRKDMLEAVAHLRRG